MLVIFLIYQYIHQLTLVTDQYVPVPSIASLYFIMSASFLFLPLLQYDLCKGLDLYGFYLLFGVDFALPNFKFLAPRI